MDSAQRRRLAKGFYPDRGVTDPLAWECLIDVPPGGVGVLALIPIPTSTQLLVTTTNLLIAEPAAGGTRDGFVALSFFVRRESSGAPGAVTQIGTQLVGAGIANVSAAVVATPNVGTGYVLSIVQTSAANAQRAAGRFIVGAVPIV